MINGRKNSERLTREDIVRFKRASSISNAHYALLILLLERRREQASRLALFGELPDQERKLFPGKSFTLFPKLPLELRRQIWRATFEPRHVDLSIHECNHSNRLIHESFEPVLPYIPIALSVNRESRTEALQYYCYIFDNYANTSLEPIELHPPVSFNPRIDSAYIADHWCWDSVEGAYRKYLFGKLLSYIDSVAPGGIGALQRLHVQGIEWRGESKLSLDSGQLSGSGILDVANTIFRFPGLKELQLEMCSHTHDPDFPNDGSHHVVQARIMKDCRINFQKFLDNHKKRFRDNKAPSVTAYIWTGDGRDPVYTPGYAYSNSTSEKWVALPWAERHEWVNLEGGIDLATKFKFGGSWDAEESEQT